MLVSLNEISKYVDISGLSKEEIASRLTFSGIEVEEIKTLSKATSLVVGKVISCIPHPNSDHLHVCKVDIKDEILDIVCGAPNCKEGIKVIVAKVGAKLPGGEIKAGEIRGYKSNGMLCALNELGVDPKYLKEEQIKGIEILSDDFEVGDSDILHKLGLDDVILDLSLLANRSDCYSLFNVSREIGALFNRKVNILEANDDSTYEEKEFKVDSLTPNCKEFSVKIVKGIEVKDSPAWLKNCLRSEGIRTINNIVDLGNYIMLLTGQPIHMYDYDKLVKKELIVRSDINEKFIALDEKEYSIHEGDICVTSSGKTMCLGGIMGGLDSEVTNDTKNIVIEVANFNHASIRRTSSRLGLVSDSSQRFVKGINKDQVDYVLNLTTNLLKTISNVDSISNIIKYDVLNHDKKLISCSVDYINNRLGTNFEYEKIKDILQLLYFKFVESDGNKFIVEVPSFRIDVEGKADLSEEIIRYIGLDTISPTLPFMETTVGGKSKDEQKEDVICSFLSNNGLYRVLTYTLVNKKMSESFKILNKSDGYVIKNPLTEDHKYVRTNLLPSLINCANYNLNHQNNNFGIYEISHIDSMQKNEIHLGVVLVGKKYKQDKIIGESYSYYDAKGIVDTILDMFNISSTRVKYTRFETDEFHPNRSALVLLDNKPLCVMGDIYPTKKEIKDSMILLEMNLSVLFATKSKNIKFEPISAYPQSSRDYAFIIDDSINYIDIKNEVKKCSSLIKEVSIFDIYKGKNLAQNEKSIALTVVFESNDHTLKDNEIDEVHNKIVETLNKKFNVSLRS
ncbi:MAG: phenylalanine--tRNA ligase subunit beta [Candidatus Onthovivens sp.]|nr:phenylalanine--tRNA ligase subunit beta [Mollicutes bacterium]MDY2724712.1 phenylalanine--tRNA ligase subunit beta [Candidatus Onthovivens sp.]MCI7225234.1 phenylalanine--tRNA ligase subunit beta [Mollicutes bacterium]MCI7268042.1 phenylalanine--tRNA ligase subunit beta [Mollicutes bacterium]MDY3778405.1 phenylalanine--tRNA ligase subunit beta [Candidatus Onthovivens sp.]